jgi:hypothetical protein
MSWNFTFQKACSPLSRSAYVAFSLETNRFFRPGQRTRGGETGFHAPEIKRPQRIRRARPPVVFSGKRSERRGK